MSQTTSEEDSEIFFTVKFLGRVEVVRSGGLQTLEDALQSLKVGVYDVLLFYDYSHAAKEKTPDESSSEKAGKKSKVHLFLSLTGVDILENKTKFLLYSCPLQTVSFCAVLPSSPKVFGFVARHHAANTYHCYLFQSKKFSHVLISVIGDAFRASMKEESVRGGKDLLVEALRHKNKMLQKENAELKKKLTTQTN